MSRLSDSSLILTSQFRVRSIILMLLLIQMANMSNLSLCQNEQHRGVCGNMCVAYTWMEKYLWYLIATVFQKLETFQG